MNRGGGLALALVASASFGTSGALATALTDIGWSPGAAVTTRVLLAALVLTIPAALQLRSYWPALVAAGGFGRKVRMLSGYGLIAVAGAQLAYFNAVQRIDVGVALLLEYLGVVLVVLYGWLRHGQRPRRLTVAGGATAVVGLLLVLDLRGGAELDPIGVMWGLIAAVGLALFYILSSRTEEPLPPLVMSWAGMVIGGAGLLLAGAIGVLPLQVRLSPVTLAGASVSWLVPVLVLAVVAAALAYVAAIGAARRLGARLASFVGLTEVLFAIGFAWLLLGQLPGPVQLVGGVVMITGVALVRVDELRTPTVTLDVPGRHAPAPGALCPELN